MMVVVEVVRDCSRRRRLENELATVRRRRRSARPRRSSRLKILCGHVIVIIIITVIVAQELCRVCLHHSAVRAPVPVPCSPPFSRWRGSRLRILITTCSCCYRNCPGVLAHIIRAARSTWIKQAMVFNCCCFYIVYSQTHTHTRFPFFIIRTGLCHCLSQHGRL